MVHEVSIMTKDQLDRKNYYDVHSHLDIKNIENFDYQKIPSKIITSPTPNIDWQKTIELSKQNSNIKYSLGIHPWSANANSINILTNIPSHTWKKAIAIGEIGLDKSTNFENFSHQKNIFKFQIEIAIKYNLPIIIHSVKSNNDILSVLKNYTNTTLQGIYHGFNSSTELAKQFMKYNIIPSIAINNYCSPISNKKEKLIKSIYPHNIVVESDNTICNLSMKNYYDKMDNLIKTISLTVGEDIDIIIKNIAKNSERIFNW